MKYVIAPNTSEIKPSRDAAELLAELEESFPAPAAIPAATFAGRGDERNELLDKGLIAKSPDRK